MDFASIYGPLDKQSCIYFFVLTILFFITFIIIIISGLIFSIKNYKNINKIYIFRGILLLFNAFMAYFVNRLLYNMCIRSLA